MSDATTKLKNSKPGSTQEEANSLTGEAGLYRHPVSKEEVVTLYDPLYGNAQSEAAIRVGFERVGDVPEGYVKTIVTGTDAEQGRQIADRVLADDDLTATLKGLNARVNEVERTAKDKDDKIASLEAQLARKDEQADTKSEAEAQTLARTEGLDSVGGTNPNDTTLTGGSNTGVVDDEGEGEGEGGDEGEGEGDHTDEKPLSKQNSTELKETATREGVEITPELDTNKKLAAAIQAKRDAEKESE